MDWDNISALLPGRSKAYCKNRWLTTQNIKINKSLWSDEEDALLAQLVTIHGTKQWKVIANELNRKTEDGNRTGKQCRERWLNYVNPEINR